MLVCLKISLDAPTLHLTLCEGAQIWEGLVFWRRLLVKLMAGLSLEANLILPGFVLALSGGYFLGGLDS